MAGRVAVTEQCVLSFWGLHHLAARHLHLPSRLNSPPPENFPNRPAPCVLHCGLGGRHHGLPWHLPLLGLLRHLHHLPGSCLRWARPHLPPPDRATPSSPPPGQLSTAPLSSTGTPPGLQVSCQKTREQHQVNLVTSIDRDTYPRCILFLLFLTMVLLVTAACGGDSYLFSRIMFQWTEDQYSLLSTLSSLLSSAASLFLLPLLSLRLRVPDQVLLQK